jgi:hypothetical protein
MRPAGLAHTVIVVQPISERETVNPQLCPGQRGMAGQRGG